MIRPVSFSNFHERTIAHFIPFPVPDKEPDFVSDSFSAYWDTGDGVVRSSDHWAGQHGCTGQASCIWSIGAEFEAGDWQSGFCAYDDFYVRQQVPILHTVAESDRQAAEALQSAGGALPRAEWANLGLQVPPWALLAFRGPSLLPAAARRLFAARPDVTHAVTADPGRLARILQGAGELQTGTRLEDLSDLPCPSGVPHCSEPNL